MKTNTILFLLMLLHLKASAQTVILSEDFESYAAGSMIAASSPNWITWTNDPAEDTPVSSAQSVSGSNSLIVTGNVGVTDVMLLFPAIFVTGVYNIEFKMFLTPGKGGYFNIQRSTTPGVAWMFEAYFDIFGGGYVNAGGNNAATFQYIPGAWNDIRLHVNFNTDIAEFYINNNMIHSYIFSSGANGIGTIGSMGGINFWGGAANAANPEYFIDDIVITSIGSTSVQEAGKASKVKIFPNPSSGIIKINFTDDNNNYQVTNIHDIYGRSVFSVDLPATGEITLPPLPDGLYFLELKSGDSVLMEKIIIKK